VEAAGPEGGRDGVGVLGRAASPLPTSQQVQESTISSPNRVWDKVSAKIDLGTFSTLFKRSPESNFCQKTISLEFLVVLVPEISGVFRHPEHPLVMALDHSDCIQYTTVMVHVPCSRWHLSNDDCLEIKRIRTVQCCVVYDSCAQ